MMGFEKASVIIPIFNEAESLEELYLRTEAVFSGLGLTFEFIAVNDGSSDLTYKRLLELRARFPNIGIINHRANHGKSMALMQGFALAEGDVAITMDADLQDEPENIPNLLDKLDEGYDMVIGWRASRKDPLSKRFVSGVFNVITRRLLNVHVHDINCGLKVMRKDLYKRLNLRGDLHRLIPAMSQAAGFTVSEVAITHAPRKYGSSKYQLLRHRGLLDIISLTSTLAYRVRPFHIFTEIAFIAWCVFSISLVGLIFTLLIYHDSPSALYVASPVLFFTSLTFLIIGTTFPVIGLILDNLLVHFNDERWRSTLVKEVLPPESC
jgi:glycosyltransferase involved in cell wall biosynthesis